jgi:hypothetical protein
MPGLVPGIHALAILQRKRTWMAGTSPTLTEELRAASARQVFRAKPAVKDLCFSLTAAL